MQTKLRSQSVKLFIDNISNARRDARNEPSHTCKGAQHMFKCRYKFSLAMLLVILSLSFTPDLRQVGSEYMNITTVNTLSKRNYEKLHDRRL